MARTITGEISWRPRRSRKANAAADSHLQPWLPFAPGEIMAGDECNIVPVTGEFQPHLAASQGPSLAWQPRGERSED
jgi:hypothetical protein